MHDGSTPDEFSIPPMNIPTHAAGSRKRNPWRLRILIALNILVALAFVFSRLDRAQIKTLGPTGQLVYDLLSPPAVPEISPEGRRLIALVKALGGSARVSEHASAFQRLIGRGETFFVSLTGADFDDEALARLVDQFGDRIMGLDLRQTRVTDNGLRHLKGLSQIRQLAVGNEDMKLLPNEKRPISPITDAGMVHLGGFTQLVSLSLDGLPITDAGLDALRNLPKLAALNVRRTKLKGPGLGRLQALRSLVILYLDDSAITDEGLALLAGASNLRVLSLEGVPLTASGLKALMNVPRLGLLDITACGLSDADVNSLRVNLPDLKIESR